MQKTDTKRDLYIDLFEHYVHSREPRRVFLQALVKAGGGGPRGAATAIRTGGGSTRAASRNRALDGGGVDAAGAAMDQEALAADQLREPEDILPHGEIGLGQGGGAG